MNISVQITLTDVVAFWGAILSTILAVWQFRRNQRRVKVKASFGLVGWELTRTLSVNISNQGERPVIIDQVSIMTNDGVQILDPKGWGHEWGLGFTAPKKLEDGESFSVFMPRSRIRNAILESNSKNPGKQLRVTGISVGDATSKRHNVRLSRSLRKWIMEAD